MIYKKICAYISKKGLSPTAVAAKAGISSSSFSAMMNGKKTIYADDLRAICLALNVSPEVFINYSDKK